MEIHCKPWSASTHSLRLSPRAQIEKIYDILQKLNNIKLKIAPVDDHRSIGMVERLITTLKTRLSLIKVGQNKSASDVAELNKTLRITPNATRKLRSNACTI